MPRRTRKVERPDLPLENELVTVWDAASSMALLLKRVATDFMDLSADDFEGIHEALNDWSQIESNTRVSLRNARAEQLAAIERAAEQ